MKIQLTLTDDRGKTYSGELELSPAPRARGSQQARSRDVRRRPTGPPARIDFDLSNRAFIRRYLPSGAAGPQKFVVLLARLAKGSTTAQIDGDNLRKEWRKVRGPMGGDFYAVYGTRAKDNGWVDSPKQGVYKLDSEWRQAFA